MRGATTTATRPRNTLSAGRTGNVPMAVENSDFETAILSNTIQNMITKSMPDERSRARFTSNLISIVSASEQLQKCKPATIIAAALRGEGMGLIINHGYYVVPYGDTASFQIGAKGYAALAMATGLYADIDCIDVREGEYLGRDFRTGKPKVDFSVYETDAEREAHPVVGYYAYFELKDGLFRGEYWSEDKLLRHAEQYSQAFHIDTFMKKRRGELTPQELNSLKRSSPWYDIEGYGFERMCKKTVLKSLLNSGYAPLSNEVRQALAADVGDMQIPFDATTSAKSGPSLASLAKAASQKPIIEADATVVDEDGVMVEPNSEAPSDSRTSTQSDSNAKPNNSSPAATEAHADSEMPKKNHKSGQMNIADIQ